MKHRFGVLDIFRGIFASFVVFFHMGDFSDTPLVNNSFFRNADVFVDFFFVLSGFVICYSYREINKGTDLVSFLKKRIFRLYPLHLFMLLMFLIVEGVKLLLQNHVQINNSLENSPATFLSSLLLLNSVKQPYVHNFSWNAVSWSISAEWISYIVFAISCFSLSLLKLGRWKVIPYLAIVFASALLLIRITQSNYTYQNYDYGFLRGLFGFFTGTVCLYLFDFSYHKVKELPTIVFDIAEVFITALIGYFVSNGSLYKHIALCYELLFFVSIYIFAFEKGFLSKSLTKIGLLKRIGKYSYSIYMTHTLVLSIFNVLFIRVLKFPPTAYWYLFALNLLAIYLLSSWTFTNVEMRFAKVKSKHVIKVID